MRDFKRLDVWKKAIELGEEIYKVTADFPKDEMYGLVSQMRRAIVSISSNIAEGCGRRTSKDFIGFLYNAMGSISEVESQLFISGKLGYIKDKRVDELVEELKELAKMLYGFIKYISGQEVR